MSWSLFSAVSGTVSGLASGVSSIATKIVETVEETTKDFEKENEAFIKQKAPHEREGAHESEAVPPWVGLHEEETLKEQIIALSEEKRNFLMEPPTGTEFVFDLAVFMPIAKAIVAHDPRLEQKRYELVPKQIKEYNFWRNYFYRVSLIKQSSQLISLGRQLEAARLKEAEEAHDSPSVPSPALDSVPDSKYDSDFISDIVPEKSEAWLEEMKDELDQLGVSVDIEKRADEEYDWEKELAKEIGDVDGKKNDSDWEAGINEILED